MHATTPEEKVAPLGPIPIPPIIIRPYRLHRAFDFRKPAGAG
jgi:hypothetical protein